MRITVGHTKTRREIKAIIDRSFDDFFQGLGALPFSIVDERRHWDADILNFSFGAKVGLLKTPIRGTIEVTDRDVTIDADLGILERLIPEGRPETLLANRVKGMLT